MTAAATMRGEILGTAAYMSPEQAKGQAVDQQADVWAFGACLYEALAGRRPFDGNDAPEMLASVLKDEPDWSALPQACPAPVRRVLRRCLAKDASRRLHSIADVAIELRDVDGESESLTVASGSAAQGSLLGRGRATWLALGLVAGGLLGAGAVWRLMSAEAWPAHEPVRFTVSAPGPSQSLALSPDGQTLVFFRNRAGLYRRELSRLEAEPLGDSFAIHPFFSSDGEEVGFFDADSLNRVALDGGPTLEVTGIDGYPAGGTWTPGGDIVFATSGSSALQVVPAAGGEAIALGGLLEGWTYSWPHVLPGGDAVLATLSRPDEATLHIGLVSLESGQTELLFEGAGARYLALDGRDGFILYWRAGAIWAVPFDAVDGAVEGRPQVVATDVQKAASTDEVRFAVGGRGSFARSIPGGRQMVWVGAEGEAEPILAEVADYQSPRVSPGGDRLAFNIEAPDGNMDVFVLDLTRDARPERLTTHPEQDSSVRWEPSGERLTFVQRRQGSFAFSRLSSRLSSGTAPEVFLRFERDAYPSSWSADGRYLTYTALGEGTGWDVWLHEEGEPERPLFATETFEGDGEISPDGRWIAYTSMRSGEQRVYVAPFPTASPARAVSAEPSSGPIWSPSGRRIYYRTQTHLMAVERMGEGNEWGRPQPLFEFELDSGSLMRDYDLAPDGRFVMLRPAGGGSEIEVVVNLAEELRRKIPRD